MQKRIAKGVCGLAILISLFLCILAAGSSYFLAQEQLDTQLRQELSLLSTWLNTEKNQEATFLLKNTPISQRVTLIDKDGVVLFDNQSTAEKMDNHANRLEVKMAFEEGEGFAKRYSDTLLSEQHYYAKKLTDGNVLRISSTQRSVAGYLSATAAIMGTALVCILLITFVYSKIWTKKVLKPINNLDLENPLNNNQYDELTPMLKKLALQKEDLTKQLNEINKNRNELRTIISHMQEGLLILDNQKHVLLMNSSACNILQCQELENENNSILYYNRNPQLLELLEKAIVQGRASCTLPIQNKEYALTATCVEDTKGLVLLLQDITEQSLAEQARKRFTANVSHELRTPLTSICGYADLLVANMVAPEDVPNFAGKIQQESQRLLKLIEDIIHLSQLDEGGKYASKSLVDLNEISSQVINRFLPLAKKKEVTITLKGSPCLLFGDSLLLDEMLGNLVENAIKYNVPQGKVNIKLTPTEDTITVSIEDTGIGIAKEHQDKVFERFYRVDRSRSKLTGGTGLGLSIVKHAAEFHQAKITLQSTLNKGTTVQLVFPIHIENNPDK